jgi:hypothetical protein
VTLDQAILGFLQSLSDPDLVALVKASKAAQRTQFQAWCAAQATKYDAALTQLDANRAAQQTNLTSERDGYNAVAAQL